jgi:phage-related protein
MKEITWVASSYEVIREYPIDARRQIGFNLDKIQKGLEPSDWKVMTGVGHGVKEIRIHLGTEYRILYVAKFPEAVYVLHSFVKKTQQTSKKDIDIGKKRYNEMLEIRRSLNETTACY